MSSSCRSFLQSLSRSALVLSLENILALARPLRWRRVTSDGAEVSGSQAALTPGGELGVSFVNVAHECGLNAKTIFGGERKNKYLLETTGCGVAFYDYDNDGWPDIYVANDSVPSAVYRNKKNGKFVDVAMDAGCALSPDGKPQAGMGVSAGDYDLDGKLDILKTNFAGDTLSLYHNLGDGNFEDVTFTAGLGLHTQFLGWGCRFFDFDNAGWPDILICNGHVYPEVEELKTEAGYAQHKLPYRNLRNGRFEDVSVRGGPGISMLVAARLCVRRLQQRRISRRGRQYRERLSAALALRYKTRTQLDQDPYHRYEVESQRY